MNSGNGDISNSCSSYLNSSYESITTFVLIIHTSLLDIYTTVSRSENLGINYCNPTILDKSLVDLDEIKMRKNDLSVCFKSQNTSELVAQIEESFAQDHYNFLLFFC